MKRMIGVLVVILGCLIPSGVSSQSSGSYRIIGGDLNAGGSVAMTSGNYRASGTIGQSGPVGTSESATYQARMGVQYIYNVPTFTSSNSFILWTK